MTDTINFIKNILPDVGDYFLVSRSRENNRFYHTRVNHSNIEKHLEYFNKYAIDNRTCSYLSFATYDESPTKYRTEALFIESKVLFIDIDIDLGGDHASVLNEFKEKFTFPLHTVIESGNGFHIICKLDTSLPANAYRQLNDLFQAYVSSITLCNAIIDKQPMTACIRLPLSMNYKKIDEPRPVYILEENTEAVIPSTELMTYLVKYITDNNIKRRSRSKKPEVTVEVGEPVLAKNIGNIFGEVTNLKASDVISNCAQIAQQSKASEFDWVGMINTLMPLDNAYDSIHMLSRKHPEYDENLTDQKILSQISISASPRKCTTFEMNRPAICQSCEFYGMKNKEGDSVSPISLAYRFKDIAASKERLDEKKTIKISDNLQPHTYNEEEDVTSLVEFDHPLYVIDKSTDSPSFGVLTYETIKIGKQVTQQEVQLYDFIPVRGVQLITDMVKGIRPIVFQIAFVDKKGREIIAELSAAECSGTKYVEALNMVGITYKSGKKQACMGFLEALVDFYRSTTIPVEATEKLGFDLTRSYFALGDKVYSKNNITRVAPRGKTAQYMIDTRASGKEGAIQAWKDCVKMYSFPGMEWCQSVIAASVAAPLLTYLNLGGSCAVSLYGESGNGKSTLQRLCTAIWGQPQKMLATGVDTNLAGFLKMGQLNSIPLHFDEMTTLSATTIGAFAYQVTQGRAKDASTDKGELRHNPSRFCSLVTLSTNKSIQSALANDKESFAAQRKRILELTTTPIAHLNPLSLTEVNMRISLLDSKYGDVGHHLIRKYINNLDFYEQKILNIGIRIDKQCKKYGYDNTDRFLTQYLVLAILGCEIGKEEGLFDFDIQAVIDFVTKEIVRVSQSIKVDEIDNMSFKDGSHYREFIRAYEDSKLIVNAPTYDIYASITGSVHKNANQTTDLVYIQSASMSKKVVVRAERVIMDKGDLVRNNFRYIISAKEFKRYCNEYQLDATKIKEGLRDAGGKVTMVTYDMWQGTSKSTGNLAECLLVEFPIIK